MCRNYGGSLFQRSATAMAYGYETIGFFIIHFQWKHVINYRLRRLILKSLQDERGHTQSVKRMGFRKSIVTYISSRYNGCIEYVC